MGYALKANSKRTPKEKLAKIGSISKTILLKVADLTLSYFEIFESSSRYAFPLASNLRQELIQEYSPRQISNAIYKLQKHNYVEYERRGDDVIIKITPNGRKKVLIYDFERRLERPKKKWDHRWHVVIFDVPEKKKRTRETIRNTLLNLGFYRLQDSVWVFPWDCKEVIEYMKEIYEARSYIYYLTVISFDDDTHFRNYFNLTDD